MKPNSIFNWSQGFLWIFALFSFIVLQKIFLCSGTTAFIIISFPLLLSVILFVNKGTLLNKFAIPYNRVKVFWLLVSAFIVFLLFTLNVIFLLRTPFFYADGWNMVHLFLFTDDLSQSILSRYNQHPTYLMNALISGDVFLLKGNTIWLILLSTTCLIFISILYFKVLFSSFNTRVPLRSKILLSASVGSFAFWMSYDHSMYWFIICFIPLLGVVLASFSLYKLDDWGFNKATLVYLFGCSIISVCFGTGAAVWWLGFCAAILQKQTMKFSIFYFIIGVIGSFLTMGLFAFSTNSVRLIDLTLLFSTIPAFIGAPFVIVFQSFFSQSYMLYFAITIGLIGLVLLCFFVFNFIKSDRSAKSKNAKLFFILLCLFTIGCSILISFGRITQDLSPILSTRFFIWSSIFWLALLALTVIIVIENIKEKWMGSFSLHFSFGVLIFLLIFNLVKIDLRLFAYNSNVIGMLDEIINPNNVGNEKLLWHPNNDYPHLRKKVHEVKEEMKRREINVFMDEWPHLINQSFSENCLNESSKLSGNFETSSIDGDVFIEGYISSSSSFDILPKAIAITSRDTIIGLGLPISNRDNRQAKKAALYNLFNLLPRPLGQFPGVSNYYFCQLIPSSIPNNLSQIKIYGIDGIIAREIDSSF